MALWTPSGEHRYIMESADDADRPNRLFDPQDGSLIEASGATLIRYPEAQVTPENGIENPAGKAWVVQDTGWDSTNESEFFALMAEAADEDHPIWADAQRHGYEDHKSTPAPRAARKNESTQEPGTLNEKGPDSDG